MTVQCYSFHLSFSILVVRVLGFFFAFRAYLIPTRFYSFLGFVSYDNPQCAQQGNYFHGKKEIFSNGTFFFFFFFFLAIQSMNGFQIGMKRLKVQLKRPKDLAKPY